MKAWELVGVVKENPGLPQDIALTKPEWQDLAEFYKNYPEYLKYNSEKLFVELDPAFVQEIAQNLKTKIYNANDGWLRLWKLYETDVLISPSEVLARYGDEVFESLMDHFATKISIT